MAIIDNIDYLLQQKNISDYKLLKDTGLSKNALNTWRNRSNPGAEAIIKLAKYFNVSSDYILGLDSENLATAPPTSNIENLYNSLTPAGQRQAKRYMEQIREIEKAEESVGIKKNS